MTHSHLENEPSLELEQTILLLITMGLNLQQIEEFLAEQKEVDYDEIDKKALDRLADEGGATR